MAAKKAVTEDRLPAVVGMKWRQTHRSDGSKIVYAPPFNLVEEVVVPSCGDKEARGLWACIEHGMIFPTNWEKASHFLQRRKNPCHLAWLCGRHGVPEVP